MSEESNVLHKRPYRLPAWVSLVIFSIVVLAAMASQGFSTSADKWVIALSSISLTFSLAAVAAYLVPHTRHAFIGAWPEAGLSVFLLLLWIAGMPVIMDPSRSIALTTSSETGLTFVRNANLYFFSWAAFLCVAFMCTSLLTENIVGAQDALSSLTNDSKLGKWFMLIVTSLIVLSSASQFQKSQCSDNVEDSETCTSNKYAISLGAVAFVFGLIITILTKMNCINIYIETATAILLCIMYTAGVGVITFNFGSGVTIGNLYFSTWFGFMIAIFLLIESYQGVAELSADSSMADLQGKQSDNGIQVEPIPEEDDI